MRCGGDGSGSEIGLKSFQQRFSAAPGPGERLERGMHQVDQGRLITAQNPEHKQVAGLNDVVVEVKPSGQQEGLSSLLVGTGDPIRPRIRATGSELPSVVPRGLSNRL